jgi:AraC family transcriptional regulator of adaptative response / DNA-3-methyladenine glycosylase II
MIQTTLRPIEGDCQLRADICERALNARDPRFDGVFFVGITTTGIYCRPVCPARVSHTERRRFYDSAAGAERAGFRPCLRCRPELAPGRALVDAISRLAWGAELRIAAGALNGRSVAELAGELGVGERHLRRALERELGVTPVELAQTHRLLLAKRLLVDTSLPVTRIAFASGFQSLRRFNAVFRDRYRLCPSQLRRVPRVSPPGLVKSSAANRDMVRLTLSYRPPLAWELLLDSLTRPALPGVELVQSGRYLRTVRLGERAGVVVVENAGAIGKGAGVARTHLVVEISLTLLPVLMPLLARLRHLFDLDAEPITVERHLADAGLGRLVRERPGLRIPGALDGFEGVFRAVVDQPDTTGEAAERVIEVLGEPAETGIPGLTRHLPTAARVARAGTDGLSALGVSSDRARVIASIACMLAEGGLRLDSGCDVTATRRLLMGIDSMSDRFATDIVRRALYWPDAFAASAPELQRAAGVTDSFTLHALAERWRPWRAYAALHLSLADRAAGRMGGVDASAVRQRRSRRRPPHPTRTAG